jgi:hypothetical protein
MLQVQILSDPELFRLGGTEVICFRVVRYPVLLAEKANTVTR